MKIRIRHQPKVKRMSGKNEHRGFSICIRSRPAIPWWMRWQKPITWIGTRFSWEWGSDDVLAMCFLTFFNSGKPVFFPDITYSFYDVWADVFRIPYECQPLDKDFRIVKEDYYRENGGVVFPNPNAPTGILMESPRSRISSVTIRTSGHHR